MDRRTPEEVAAEVPVARFVSAASAYCGFIERAAGLEITQRILEARESVAHLYAAGCGLPMVEPPDGFDAENDVTRPEDWPGFDRHEFYWEVFNVYGDGETEGIVAGDLSDDLLDIYFDVRRGLRLWASEAPRAAAIWEWRFGFDAHWGNHAVNALRALQRAANPY